MSGPAPLPDRPQPSPARSQPESQRYPTVVPRPGRPDTRGGYSGRHAKPATARQHHRVRHLITGATGYVGGRLAPRLLAAGRRRALPGPRPRRSCATCRGPATSRWSRGDLLDRGRRAPRLRGRRRRLLPRPLAGRAATSRRSTAARPRSSPRPPATAACAGSSTSAACTPTATALGAPARRARGRRDPARQRRADRRAAGRRHPRLRVGVVRDAALPHRAAAGDGHAAVGRQPDPADRHPRRAALPRRRRAGCPRTSTAPSTSAAPTSSPTAR